MFNKSERIEMDKKSTTSSVSSNDVSLKNENSSDSYKSTRNGFSKKNTRRRNRRRYFEHDVRTNAELASKLEHFVKDQSRRGSSQESSINFTDEQLSTASGVTQNALGNRKQLYRSFVSSTFPNGNTSNNNNNNNNNNSSKFFSLVAASTASPSEHLSKQAANNKLRKKLFKTQKKLRKQIIALRQHKHSGFMATSGSCCCNCTCSMAAVAERGHFNAFVQMGDQLPRNAIGNQHPSPHGCGNSLSALAARQGIVVQPIQGMRSIVRYF